MRFCSAVSAVLLAAALALTVSANSVPTAPTVPTAPVSPYDAELIARAVAVSYPDAGFAAKVGLSAVVLNRMRDPAYPDTAAGVLRAAGSGFDTDRLASLPDADTDAKALRIARDACEAALAGSDPTGGCVTVGEAGDVILDGIRFGFSRPSA